MELLPDYQLRPEDIDFSKLKETIDSVNTASFHDRFSRLFQKLKNRLETNPIVSIGYNHYTADLSSLMFAASDMFEATTLTDRMFVIYCQRKVKCPEGFEFVVNDRYDYPTFEFILRTFRDTNDYPFFKSMVTEDA